MGLTIVDNFTLHPDPSDLQANETFIALAQAEFAANRSGMLTLVWIPNRYLSN